MPKGYICLWDIYSLLAIHACRLYMPIGYIYLQAVYAYRVYVNIVCIFP